MVGLEFVRPLEDDWRDTLDGVARSRGWPTSHDVAALAARVADLSNAYNDPARARASVRQAGSARLGFSFARDVPKGAAAVRELVAAAAMATDGPLQVLDVGAGLGAMTWGLARAIEAAGRRLAMDATWIDADSDALDVGLAIVRARRNRFESLGRSPSGSAAPAVAAESPRGRVELSVRTNVRPVSDLDGLGRYDIVLVGNVLSELGVGDAEDVRVEPHVALLRRLLERHTREHGSLVVVEPALRDRTRHLHRVHDALAQIGVAVFAPCLHAARCPALDRDSDWCHEQLPIDLPAWLVPVARAAGLRREGLTFSYLVLRSDGARLVDALVTPAGSARLRIVSDRIESKGKCEAFLCGEFSTTAGGPVAARGRVARLDRDASRTNDVWSTMARGDLVAIDPALELSRARVGRETSVRDPGMQALAVRGVV
jgi:hypothetical protein